MIHTKELMLGNWVEFEGLPNRVTLIGNAYVWLNGETMNHHYTSICGIQITEELLEKCGFHRSYVRDIDTCGTPYRNRNVLAFLADGNVVLYTDETKHNIADINFLHELQNAYFMLTKKHLEVKL